MIEIAISSCIRHVLHSRAILIFNLVFIISIILLPFGEIPFSIVDNVWNVRRYLCRACLSLGGLLDVSKEAPGTWHFVCKIYKLTCPGYINFLNIFLYHAIQSFTCLLDLGIPIK